MKIIITHLNPDLDAICSVWLLKRFLPGWKDAEVKFIPAGVVKIESVQKDGDEVLVVDTGFGELDHHQLDERTCAAKLVWEKIKKESNSTDLLNITDALDRLVNVVLRIDFDAEDITMQNAADDFYSFLFNERQILRGFRTLHRGQSDRHLEFGFTIFDSVFEVLKAKIEAEEIIKKGIVFDTVWGRAIASSNNNEMYMHVAQEMGYKVVISKEPKKGHVRIHGLPKNGIDFTKWCEKLQQADPEATWFLHKSLSLLLNGSTANPDMKPTKLELEEVVKIISQ